MSFDFIATIKKSLIRFVEERKPTKKKETKTLVPIDNF